MKMTKPCQRRLSTAAEYRLAIIDRRRNGLTGSRSVRRTRARSWRAARCAVLLTCALPATLALGASAASAYVRINEHCLLRAFEPAGGSNFIYAGAVDCSAYGNVWTSIEVCAEVQNTGNGVWYQISGSCRSDGPLYRALNELGAEHEGGICGVNYRTWDYGVAWHGGSGGHTSEWGHAEYRSSAVKVC
jgi:hypothetical protein